jgi:hypothetical protein
MRGIQYWIIVVPAVLLCELDSDYPVLDTRFPGTI